MTGGVWPWQVRVRARAFPANILGAGVLLGHEHVLTCAHVALKAAELTVDLVGLDGIPRSEALLVDRLCVPASADQLRGDVAVLRLREPQPHGVGAQLRRLALTWDRPVHTLGYPDGLDVGAWARMTLAGRVGVEWVQMNRRSKAEQRVRAGFSGAGVIDDQTGDVLGIVVTEYTDGDAGLAYMLPTEAIISHLPLVSEWVVGDSGVDPGFTRSAPGDGRPAALATDLADWLRRRQDGPAVLVVLGPDLDAVRAAVALSNPDSTGLAPVDLALDVDGQTVEEVSRRIVSRAGLATDDAPTAGERVRAGTPPMTIVAIEVDQAEEPEALLGEVFAPMARSGARLVLCFRDEDSASVAVARELAVATVKARLDGYTTRLAALAGEGQLGDQISALRLRLSELRMAAATEPERVAERLPAVNQCVARIERRLATRRRHDAAISADRGLLDAMRAMAAADGLIEHVGLAKLYRVAMELLAADPVDENAVRAAVAAYGDAVRASLAALAKEQT
ncbi:S1 family peptidase [Actinophytocola sediminis]